MNCFACVGNLTRDPESGVTASGTDVCKFTVAINRPKGPNGESVADFIPIRAYKRRASICREYLKKGSKVAIVGSIQTFTYQTQDGVKKNGFVVIANEITLLPSSNPNKAMYGEVHSDIYGASHHSLDSVNTTIEDGFEQIDDDELPF